MINTQHICTILALSTLSTQVMANGKSTSIIYGEDNRIETYQADKKLQKLASSTAGMLSRIEAVDLGDAYMLPPKSISDAMGLCKNERFKEQPSAVSCSGFLVGPDLLVTAGHCVTSQERCEEVSFVFDYKIEEKTNRANMIVGKDKVYKCKKLIDAKLLGNSYTDQQDYALVKLDRVVKGKAPLKYRTTGMVEDHAGLVVIGHPSGLPQKIAADANVYTNRKDRSFFVTNLDTFGGNSGSAVFNEKTGVVEGILVRGAKDYKRDPISKCLVVNTEAHDISDRLVGRDKLGESVSRITDIPSLKYRKLYLQAAAKGNMQSVKDYLLKGVDVDMVDNFGNTALHKAVSKRNMTLAKFLINTGIDFEAKNKLGKTAMDELGLLHIKSKRILKRAIQKAKAKKRKTI